MPPRTPSALGGPGDATPRDVSASADVTEINGAPRSAQRDPSHAETAIRLAEAEDTLRAIGAGEVDAFVIAHGAQGHRVFTLETADRPYRTFVENMRDGAATLSSDGTILYANASLAALLARPSETVVGSNLSDLIDGVTRFDLDRLRDEDGSGTTLELAFLRPGQASLSVLVGSFSLNAEDDNLLCITVTDLSAQKRQEQEIQLLSQDRAAHMAELQHAQIALTRQATHDDLTGLPNRPLLVDRIDRALAQAERTGRHTAVMFVDLDRFKAVNDRQGHAAGDALLCRVASKLVAALRPMDTVARIGGDEFAILVPDIDSPAHAVELSNRVLVELDPPGAADRIGASIGVAVAVGGNNTAERLLADADSAMYRAKARGGTRAEVFDEALGQDSRDRVCADELLSDAIDHDPAQHEPWSTWRRVRWPAASRTR